MKVIDLLNKIANNEEVPKKIKYKEEIYNYFEGADEVVKLYMLDEQDIGWFDSQFLQLDTEFEIIEEKPKKIEEIYHCCMESENPEIQVIVDNINFMSDKINELQKAVNYLLEKESE